MVTTPSADRHRPASADRRRPASAVLLTLALAAACVPAEEADDREGVPALAWSVAPDSVFPSNCGPARAVYSGSLCGPGSAPCAVLEHVVADPARHFRNASAGMAIGDEGHVELLYSVAVGGYHGWRATRAPGADWSLESIAPEVATASLAAGPDGRIWGAAYGGGSASTTLWSWTAGESGQMLPHGPVPADVFGAEAAAADTAGCLHLGTVAALGWSRYDGETWQQAHLSATPLGGVDLDVVGAGHVHLAARVQHGDGWATIWSLASGDAAGERPIEAVFRREGNVFTAEQVYVAVGPSTEAMPEGVPHLLTYEDGGLLYAHRTGPDAWTSVAGPQSAQLGDPGCAFDVDTDAPEGSTCEWHELTVRPFGLVASGNGDVRLIWGEAHRRATLTAQWADPGGRITWGRPAEAVSGHTELFVGAVIDDTVRPGEPVQLGTWASAATVVLGPAGTLYVTVYGDEDLGAAYDVRVLRIGAR